MDPSSEDIAEINNGIERYNPNHINQLFRYLEYQIRENKYDKEANLSLLKLIQLSLETDDVETAYVYLYQDHNVNITEVQQNYDSVWKIYSNIVFKLLIKAMMQMPRSHFTLMKSMINIEHHQHELIGWSFLMYDLLDCCHFEKFWKEISAVPDRVNEFVGFEESVRRYICYAISKTFQNVPLSLAQKYLGLSDVKDIQSWCEKMNWKIQDGQIYCGNLESNIKTKKITETLSMQTGGIYEVLANGVTLRGLAK